MRAHLVAGAARSTLLGAVGLLALGCAPGGSEGELGNGRFFYTCVSEGDPFCSDYDDLHWAPSSIPPPVPAAVVVGAAFDLEFDLDPVDDETSFAVDVSCVVDGFAEQRHFRPTREGWLGFVAERSDGSVADVFHILVAAPETIELATRDRSVGGSLSIDGITHLSALPRGAGGERLFGAFEATWESSDPSIVAVQEGGAPIPARGPIATLVPVSVGDVTVTVTVAGVSQQIDVSATGEVLP